LKVRQEKPSDFQDIYDLVKVGFQTAEVSNGNEQDYVIKLRASGNYIPELALVAEESGKLIGYIMLTKTYVSRSNSKFEALLLAPLCIALEQRNLGIGSKLVVEGLKLTKNLGYTTVFVVGNPLFYSRFGFQSSVHFGIKHVPMIPDQFVMVNELSMGVLTDVVGTVTFT
jgi:predicted N-acetyltransferase YhbS